MTRYLCLFIVLAASTASGEADWKEKLRDRLPLLGHRNWIVIADSAYPLQTAPGIETVWTDADQLEVVRTVLNALSNTRHVRPIVHVDSELKFVAEKNAPGIGKYREALEALLAGKAARPLAHEKIIAKLDEAGKTFSVLLLKTKLTLPYTSVFLELDCGYWSAASEEELRAAIKAAR